MKALTKTKYGSDLKPRKTCTRRYIFWPRAAWGACAWQGFSAKVVQGVEAAVLSRKDCLKHLITVSYCGYFAQKPLNRNRVDVDYRTCCCHFRGHFG